MRIEQNQASKYQRSNVETAKQVNKGQATLEKGTVVKGVIQDLKGNEVKIQLANNEVLTARLADSFNFHIGQEVTLAVKDSNVEQIILTPISDEQQAVQDKLVAILEQADLKTTDTNLAVVRELLQNEMPVNKDMINQVIRSLAKFPDMAVKDILFMIKNNIPINQNNVQNLQSFMAQKPLFFEQLQSTIQNVSASIVANATNLSTVQNSEVGQTLEQSLGFTETDLNTMNALKGFVSGQGGQTSSLAQFSETNINQLVDILNGQVNGGNVEKINQLLGTLNTEGTEGANSASLMTEEVSAQGTNSQEVVANQSATNLISTDSTSTNSTSTNSISTDSIPTNATPTDAIQTDLAAVNLSPINSSHITTLDQIENLIALLELDTEAEISLKESLIKPLINEMVEKQMLMQYETFQKPDSVSKYFEQLYNQIAFISKRLSSDSSNIGKEKDADNIKSGLEFVKSFNQNFQFLELPMLFNDQMLNGELYILDRGASKKTNKEAVSALLQLDFLNLGHLDIYINKMQESIDMHFYTEDDKVTKIIKNDIGELNQQLVEKGFVVKQILVEVKAETVDIKETIMDEKDADHDLKHITFDIRV